MQPPGRAMRSAEPCITSARQLAAQLLPVIASRLQSAPYVVCMACFTACTVKQQVVRACLALCSVLFMQHRACEHVVSLAVATGSARAASLSCCGQRAECFRKDQQQRVNAAPYHLLRGGKVSKLLSCPPQIIAHSVGTWVAFELLAAARGAGLPMPRAAFLSAMAAPDMPEARRPWRRQRELSEADFQVTYGASCCALVASCFLPSVGYTLN